MTTPSDDSSMTNDAEKTSQVKLVNINGESVLETDSEMSVGDHLHDLRNAVLYAMILPVIVTVVAWIFHEEIHNFLVSTILSEASAANLSMNTTMSAFSLAIKLTIHTGIVVGMPWIVLQGWRFVSPGLYPNERRFAGFALPFSIALFYAGAIFALYLVLPLTFDFLMTFDEGLIPKANYSVNDFYELSFMLMMVLGICFQMPVVVAPLVRFGILKPELLKKHRRVIIFVIAVVAAAITPTGDPVTMTLVGLPLWLLLEAGVFLGIRWKRLADKRDAEGPQTLAEGWEEGISGEKKRHDISEEGLLGGKAADSFATSIGKMAQDFAEGMKKSGEVLSEAHEEVDALDEKDQPAEPAPAEPAPKASPEPPPAPEGMVAVKKEDIPQAPVAPKAPLPGISRAETNVPGVAPGSQVPEHLLDPNRPVPKLPRELRRRIDHYIHERLEELLEDVFEERSAKESQVEDKKDDDA